MSITPEERIDNLSIHYYNLGLENARVRNLSGAAEYLERSLEIDKRNTDARNLLGLVYYAMGELVEALSAWVVSKHFCPDDNPADEYLNEVQGDPVNFDMMSQAISKYNKGLEFAREGKTDLAMIQLKKAVSTYPNFVRAMQLLAVLFMMNNEADKAAKLIYRILKIDCANAAALYYIKEIDSATAAGKVLNAEARDMVEESFAATKLEDEVTEAEILEDEPNVMAFIGLLAGILIGVAVVFFLIVPNRDASIREEYRNSEKNYSENLNVKLARINALETEAAKMVLQNAELQASLTEARSTIDSLINETPEYAIMFNRLFASAEVYMEYAINKKVAASMGWAADTDLLLATADSLAGVDITLTSDDAARRLYEGMCDEVMEKASTLKYNEGMEAFNVGWYSRAVDCLHRVVTYNPKDDKALFYLARSYEGIGDKENALMYYNELLDNFANSSFSASALDRIAIINDN